jgi:chromosome segregation ATPase
LDHIRSDAKTLRSEKDALSHSLSLAQKEVTSLTSNLAATREMLNQLRSKTEAEAKVHQEISLGTVHLTPFFHTTLSSFFFFLKEVR